MNNSLIIIIIIIIIIRIIIIRIIINFTVKVGVLEILAIKEEYLKK